MKQNSRIELRLTWRDLARLLIDRCDHLGEIPETFLIEMKTSLPLISIILCIFDRRQIHTFIDSNLTQ